MPEPYRVVSALPAGTALSRFITRRRSGAATSKPNYKLPTNGATARR